MHNIGKRGIDKTTRKSRLVHPKFSQKLARQMQTPPSLYAGFAALPPPRRSIISLERYLPLGALLLTLCFILMSVHPWPKLDIVLLCLAFIASVGAMATAFSLFMPHPQLGFWPANRVASLIIMVVMLDYWIWIFGGSFDAPSAYLFMLTNAAFFIVIVFALFFYFFRHMHIGNVIKVLFVKSLFDFSVFILSGGLGFSLFRSLGIVHPLRVKPALAVIAMVEIAVVLMYLLRYRKKIIAPGS